jgi:hypothetical protein
MEDDARSQTMDQTTAKYASETLGCDFQDQQSFLDYMVLLGEDSEKYDVFKDMLRKMKRSTLYKNEKVQHRIKMCLKYLEQALELPVDGGRALMVKLYFTQLINLSMYVSENYVAYIPFCKDFEML